MDFKGIRKFILDMFLVGKKNLTLLIAAVAVLLIVLALRKSDVFLVVKAPSNRQVKIEINDVVKDSLCLDAPSKEDSILMMDVLYDRPYTAKKIEFVAIHTTDSPEPKKNSTVEYWKDFFFRVKYPGSKMYGYNYLVTKDKVLNLRPLNKNSTLEKSEIVWGVANFNSRTVSIAYEGGRIKKNGKWVDKIDTRSERQKFLVDSLIKEVKLIAPNAVVKGHGQFPGVSKSCPNYKI